MMTLLQELSQIGDVILVRFVEETMWVTFRDGQCALAAASKQKTEVSIIEYRKLFFIYIIIHALVFFCYSANIAEEYIFIIVYDK